MRFLVDRCAGRRLANWLRQNEHDVVESLELGPDPGDRALLEKAEAQNRVLITMDKDFGEFVFRDAQKHAGIVRLPDVPADARILLMEKVLSEHSHEIDEKAIVTVRGGRIRISRAP